MSETYEPKFKRSPAHTYWQHKAEKAEERCRELEGALKEIMSTEMNAGVWSIGCGCEVRLPQIYSIGRAVLMRGAKGGGNG